MICIDANQNTWTPMRKATLPLFQKNGHLIIQTMTSYTQFSFVLQRFWDTGPGAPWGTWLLSSCRVFWQRWWRNNSFSEKGSSAWVDRAEERRRLRKTWYIQPDKHTFWLGLLVIFVYRKTSTGPRVIFELARVVFRPYMRPYKAENWWESWS